MESFPHFRNFIFGRKERVELEDCRSCKILGRFNRRGISHDAHYPLPRFLFGAEDVDVIAVAFAHLLPVDSRNDFRCRMNPWLGQFENLPESFVHLYRKIPRDFDVLLLIFADRHGVAVVNQNIGRHQHGIIK